MAEEKTICFLIFPLCGKQNSGTDRSVLGGIEAKRTEDLLKMQKKSVKIGENVGI